MNMTHIHNWNTKNVGNTGNIWIIVPIIITWGPLYLFTLSLSEINKIYLQNNCVVKKYLLIFNGSIMAISGFAYIYTICELINFLNFFIIWSISLSDKFTQHS